MTAADRNGALRVAAFGLFGRTNLGNEATIAAFLHHLRHRFPDARVTCIAPQDSSTGRDFGVDLLAMEPLPVRHLFWGRGRWARPISRLTHRMTEPLRQRAARKLMAQFDAFVIPGTGVLDDYGQTALDLPSTLQRWCGAARRTNVPAYLVSVGAEPVNDAVIRRMFRDAVSACGYRSYRDDESRTNALALGIAHDGNTVYPDLAFSLPPTMLGDVQPPAWPPRRIGVGVMGYYGWNKRGPEAEATYQLYLDKLTRFVTELLMEGYEIRLLVGDTRADERPVRDVVERVRSSVARPASNRLIAERIQTFTDLLGQLRQTDVVVATRLHNIVLALLMERPVISVSYSRKTDVLLEEYGFGELRQHVESFDPQLLMAQLRDLAARPVAPTERISTVNARYRRELEEQYARIFDPLQGAAPQA